MTVQAAPDWYPDPSGRHEMRYWDGSLWTEHVATGGVQATDPPLAASAATSVDRTGSKKVQRQVRGVGVTESAGSAQTTLLTAPVLVVNQKGKLLEVNAQYAIYDQHGRELGSVREVGQSLLKKATAAPNRTRRLQILDTAGGVVLALTQPTRVLTSTMLVRDAEGVQVGEISRKFSFGQVRFGLVSEGRTVGTIQGENSIQSDFGIKDSKGNEIGRISRTSAGLAKEMFTKADHYVVEIHRQLEEPLRSLVVAAALAVDTALRQR
ncbi:scramblase [Terrabacter tumescens]|uniref:Scramblase n=1 Tax=Terrabacter tumescens TaxID=60443 RepID=A0ABQ2IJR2_9MICO|nr:phospholipid scramblase-related protein [Terrabacter tumescens]GGN10599.1 scramblase [Terrabacter tumescens]